MRFFSFHRHIFCEFPAKSFTTGNPKGLWLKERLLSINRKQNGQRSPYQVQNVKFLHLDIDLDLQILHSAKDDNDSSSQEKLNALN